MLGGWKLTYSNKENYTYCTNLAIEQICGVISFVHNISRRKGKNVGERRKSSTEKIIQNKILLLNMQILSKKLPFREF